MVGPKKQDFCNVVTILFYHVLLIKQNECIGRCLNFVTGFKNAVTKGTNWHNWSDEIVWKFQIPASAQQNQNKLVKLKVVKNLLKRAREIDS